MINKSKTAAGTAAYASSGVNLTRISIILVIQKFTVEFSDFYCEIWELRGNDNPFKTT